MITKRISVLTLLLTTSLSSRPVLALDDASDSSGGTAGASASQSQAFEEIIVTAEKRSEKLGNVPMSITAATGDQLSELGITSAADLSKIVPGFTFTQSTYGAPVYTLRGIGTYDEAMAISPAVGVYTDQIPLPFARMTEGASLDLQRVEVLKGPQGTLFGENSTGGAVNYIPNHPTDHIAAGGALTFGRFNETDAEGYVSGPLDDKVKARVAFRTEQRGDWQYNTVNSDTLGQRHFTTGRALVDFEPNDKLKWSLNVNGWVDGSDVQAPQKIGYAALTPGGYPGSRAYPNLQALLQAYPNAPADDRAASWDTGSPFKRNDSFVQIGLRGDWQVADAVTITSLSAWSHLSANTPADSDGTIYPDSYVLVYGSVDTFTQELRAAGQLLENDKLKWMFGLNYEHDDSNDNQFLDLNATNTGIGPLRFTNVVNQNLQKVDTEAVFGSLEYNILDTLTAQGSIRYTNQDRSFHGGLKDSGVGDLAAAFGSLSSRLSGSPTIIPPGGYITLNPVTNKPLANGLDSKLDQDNLSWKVGLSWKPAEDLLFYANATKGWKAGAFGTLPVIRPSQDAPVTQESVMAYETGFKVTAFDRTAQFSGALFHYNYDNKQLLAAKFVGFPFGTLPALVNIPRSAIDGGELDVAVRPFQDVKLRAGATYLYSRVLDHFTISSPVSGPNVDIGGEQFPGTPRWQYNADAEYDHPISDNWIGFAGASVTYESKTPGMFGNIAGLELPHYTLVDLRAGVDSGTWRIQFWGRNITNEYYRTHAFRPTDTLIATTGFPATYGITISARF